MLRFRHFRTQLVITLLGLVIGTTALGYFVTQRVSERNATAEIEADFQRAAVTFLDLAIDQNTRFGDYAAQLGSDYALKRVLASDDVPTLTSALVTQLGRSRADVVFLADGDGSVRAQFGLAAMPENPALFQPLLQAADESGNDRPLSYPYLDGELHGLAFAPVRTGETTIAWLGLGYRIDQRFVRRLKALCDIDLIFVHADRIVATTLPADQAKTFVAAFAGESARSTETRTLTVAGERWLAKETVFPHLKAGGTIVLEVSSLDARLAPTRAMLTQVLLASLGIIAVSVLLALAIARGVSRPVQELAAHTRVIAGGDYTRRIDLRRADELGQLATAFNEMSTGLAERDRVRDLLDKNVSPEVAAQLLRDGAALGGEERQVTILFADLRGFTTLSEQLPPRELLTLLNRYLDRMSAEIERQGGVIDKFIGDAIMALFGAPLPQNDAAARALAAACAMESALAALNVSLATEGKPPLALGIGVNTARVVAGNIGSQRRLNYSVIGDGVNVAARLQSLTRTPEYHTNIIASAATLSAARHEPHLVQDPKKFGAIRPLGSVHVKGRTEPVEIFAVNSLP